MRYNFILSESEKREILNKHNSYKNFLNEESVAPSVMDIQLKLIKLGYENLLGTGKADNKFGKYTCNAILSALTLLKQVGSTGDTENIPNTENIPTVIKDCISSTANSEKFDSFGNSFIMKTNGTVSPDNRQLLFSQGQGYSKNGKTFDLPPFCKIDIVNTDCTSKMKRKDPSLIGGSTSVNLEGSIELVNQGTIKSMDKDKFGASIDVKVNGTSFCNATMRIPSGETPKVEEPKKDESGKIPGKIYPLGNEAGDAGIDVTN